VPWLRSSARSRIVINGIRTSTKKPVMTPKTPSIVALCPARTEPMKPKPETRNVKTPATTHPIGETKSAVSSRRAMATT